MKAFIILILIFISVSCFSDAVSIAEEYLNIFTNLIKNHLTKKI